MLSSCLAISQTCSLVRKQKIICYIIRFLHLKMEICSSHHPCFQFICPFCRIYWKLSSDIPSMWYVEVDGCLKTNKLDDNMVTLCTMCAYIFICFLPLMLIFACFVCPDLFPSLGSRIRGICWLPCTLLFPFQHFFPVIFRWLPVIWSVFSILRQSGKAILLFCFIFWHNI